MDALGTQTASASLHNSVSETPPFWAGKKTWSLIIGHPFPPPQLYKDDRYIYIDMDIAFDIKHCCNHLTWITFFNPHKKTFEVRIISTF